MNMKLNKTGSRVLLASLIAVLSACGGSSSDSSSSIPTDVAAPTAPQESATLVATDFSFPTIAEANGVIDVMVPEGALPTFSARRTLSEGNGSTVGFGDPVVVKYSMYSWTTGELVETTDSFDEPLSVRAGVTEGLPEYLTRSLLGRKIGDQLQIVFASGMEDLPPYLDNSDAYILVVDLI